MLKHIAASLALTVGVSHAIASENQKLNIEVQCTNLMGITAVLEEFGEHPLLTGIAGRPNGDKIVGLATILFVNPETQTWTLVEQFDKDLYCATASGSDIKPFDYGPSV